MNWDKWEDRDTKIREICSKISKETGYHITNLPIKDKLVFQGDCIDEALPEYKREILGPQPKNTDDVYKVVLDCICDEYKKEENFFNKFLKENPDDLYTKECFIGIKRHLEKTVYKIQVLRIKEIEKEFARKNNLEIVEEDDEREM